MISTSKIFTYDLAASPGFGDALVAQRPFPGPGCPLKRRFLQDLIPPTWQEQVLEYELHYAVMVEGERLSDREWDQLYQAFEARFQTDLIECYSYTSNGVSFTVYLRKTVIQNERERKLARILHDLPRA